MDIERRVESISTAMAKLDEARQALGGEFAYTMKQLVNFRRLLITKYAPFPVGSWVRLAKDWTTTDPNSGWRGSQHFLVKGAIAQVMHVEAYDDGDLKYEITFENESWVDLKGEIRPITQKHTYSFGGSWLELLNADKLVAPSQAPGEAQP